MRTHAVLLIALSLLLSGCSLLGFEPSPTTTYTDETGAEVTVDWVNYPAYEGIDGEKLIGFPDQAELEPAARELVEQLRVAIVDSSGLAMTSSEPESDWFGDKNWYPQSGNGYGGESMLTTVNCATSPQTAPLSRASGSGFSTLPAKSRRMRASGSSSSTMYPNGAPTPVTSAGGGPELRPTAFNGFSSKSTMAH
ncbi:hypothetical protein [Salinibacterium sp. PAMC 21357]|uniref:hypothetical protein n=1 Tax=Salinibacterium sp. PAMC 21357 TaxID=1112215 RepID=UPI000287F67F|nr:hypothetical protein [Salinibacterium sp. PAMC 21357]